MFRYLKTMGKDPNGIHYTKQGADGNYLWDRLNALGEKIFINSMTDTFHKDIPDSEIERWLFAFEHAPQHQFQILTKRAERMYDFFCTHKCPENVWLGVSVENQEYLKRIDQLRTINCKVRFVSFEPLLGRIEKPNLEGVHWIIIGGESGDNPRPMNPLWAQELIDYTRTNYPDCAIFFKQMGGKGRDGAGGDLLYEKQYHEFPKYK
jgi:protein gp37